MIDINKFLQLDNPDIARQTRNMSYLEALKSEIPGTKSYQGYNPFYKGADKTGLGGYIKQGLNSIRGSFQPGSNVGGATPLTRKLAQDAMRIGSAIKGVGASTAGRSALARTLGTLLGGTVVNTAGILTSPYIAMANQLYGPNVEKAQEFAGMYGEAMPEDMYEEYSSYLGQPETSQASNSMISDTVLAEPGRQFEDYPGVENLAGAQRFDLQGVQDIISQMEEEKGNYIERPEDRFSLSGILENLKGYGRDAAGRYIGSQALGRAGAMTFGIPGAIIGTIGGLMGGGNLFNPNTYSQNAYNFSTPQGQKYIDTLYNPGGIMSGYNKIHAGRRGPLESITNRISKTTNPAIRQKLIAAGKNITDSGQDTSKTGYNAVTQKGTYAYDDVNVGGSGTGGSGGKIVCTMMNESYGFGNFRNKIWLKHSKDLPKEYEIGYHAIFLPLVKFAKKKGKLNKLVKKTLEHVAKHRTIDLKQEMRGKKHLLGRIYRKVLEPICYLVGKIKNA